MREITIKIAGNKYIAKNLDEDFAKFIEEDLKSSGILLDENNNTKQFFGAYLHLANRWYHNEKEINKIISNIEKEHL